MKTSVVIATYNGEKFLEKQLDSIIRQTKLPDEIIIGDDCSNDNTITILKKFKQDYYNIDIKVIKRNENVGYVRNFIDLINQASNEIVFLCDQDDIWTKDKIDYCLDKFLQHSNLIALHCDTSIIDKDDKVIINSFLNYKNDFEFLPLTKMVKRINYCGMSLIFKKDMVINQLNEITNKNIEIATHDWLICYLSSIKNGLFLSNKILSYRRDTGVNVALRLNEPRISTIEKRIAGIELYEKCYLTAYKYHLKCQVKSNVDFKSLLEVLSYRKKYLSNCDILRCISYSKKIKLYPSNKSFFGDLLLLLKMKVG